MTSLGGLAVICLTEAALPPAGMALYVLVSRRAGVPARPGSLVPIWAGIAAALAVVFLAAGVPWPVVATEAAIAAAMAAVWWWRRRWAARAYGAKSRARIGALVARQRASRKRRPVFAPAPLGGG